MYSITKEFAFEAAHHLVGLPADHQCARQHGHSYRVEVELSSETLTRVGFIVDYGELDKFASYLKHTFDHQDINYVLDVQTSAENLAKHFYNWCVITWPETTAVRVSETQKCWAEYKP